MRKVALSVDLETAEILTPTEESRLFMEITKTIAAVLGADVRVAMAIKSSRSQESSLFLKIFSS